VRAIVVGGGISGLTCALRLRQARPDLDLELLEASDRVGGVIQTARAGALIMELGPDSIVSNKPHGLELARELGLEGELLGTDERFRKSFVVRGNRLHPVPDGFYLLAPSSLWPFVRTPLFSWPGKLRMALDLVLPRRKQCGDESLAAFVRRRLGQEALDRMAQPMAGGIHTADPETLSLSACFPQFQELEKRHRSIILGLARGGAHTAAKGASGARYSLFLSFKEGLEELPRTLAGRLSAVIHRSCRVEGLARSATGWTLKTNLGNREADLVCLAVPAHAAARLLSGIDDRLSSTLGAILHVSSATVNLAYASRDVPHPLPGAGMVVPALERTTLMACSFSSRKYAGRAPEGTVLLRAFVGGALHADRYALPDADLLAGVQHDLRQLLGITAAPERTLLTRFPGGMPQYTLGHSDRVATIRDCLRGLPNLVLAGNAYDGVGIPDCIRSGTEAAEQLLEGIQTRTAGAR
jgi:oxygen-dependent protoporphyrinogen oxidase